MMIKIKNKCPIHQGFYKACLTCEYTQRIGFCWYPNVVGEIRKEGGWTVVHPFVKPMPHNFTWPELEADYERRAHDAVINTQADQRPKRGRK